MRNPLLAQEPTEESPFTPFPGEDVTPTQPAPQQAEPQQPTPFTPQEPAQVEPAAPVVTTPPAPIPSRQLTLSEVARRSMMNIIPSAWNNAIDALSFFQPVGTRAEGTLSDAGILPDAGTVTAFPRMQDLVELAVQSGVKGYAGLTGTEVETRLIDGVIDYYKRNYGLGPEGAEGFKRFIAEDPVGFITDMLTVASLGSSGAAAGSRGIGRAINLVKRGKSPGILPRLPAYDRFSDGVYRVNRVVNHGFTVPTPIAEAGAAIAKRTPRPVRWAARKLWSEPTDVAVSLGSNRGALKRGLNIGLVDVIDPGALVTRAAMRETVGRVSKGLFEVDKALIDQTRRQGIDPSLLPGSAQTGSPAIAAAEAHALKSGDKGFRKQLDDLAESIRFRAEELARGLADGVDFETAGQRMTDGMQDFVAKFHERMDVLYSSIADLKQLPAVLRNTREFFKREADEARKADRLMRNASTRSDAGNPEYDAQLRSIERNVAAEVRRNPDVADYDPAELPRSEDVQFTPSGDVDAQVVGRTRAQTRGKTRMIKGNWGDKYEGVFDVVDLNELQPSHFPDGSTNPNYPTELQPRARGGDPASITQVRDIARTLDPEKLLDDTSAMNGGAPIVGPTDNFVESGNGRVMGMLLAAQTPEWQDGVRRYVAELTASIEEYGLDPAVLDGKAIPVLVRRRQDDVDRVRFTQEANDAEGLEMRNAERALTDVKYMSPEVLALLDLTGTGNLQTQLRSAANNDFAYAFIQKFPANQHALFFDTTGNVISDQGWTRISNALMRAVFDGEFGTMLGGKFVDVSEQGWMNVRDAIRDALPQLAHVESLIRDGQRPSGLSVTEPLAQAVLKLMHPDAQGMEPAVIRDQISFYDDLSDNGRNLLLIIDRAKQQPSALTEFLRLYSRRVETATGDSTPDMVARREEVAQDARDRLQTGDAWDPNAPTAGTQMGFLDATGVEQPSVHADANSLELGEYVTQRQIVLELLGRNFDEVPDTDTLQRRREEGALAEEAGDAPGDASPETPPTPEQARVTLQETRQEPLLWGVVDGTRRALGKKIFAKKPAPIVTQNMRYYMGLYHALTADMKESIARHAPEKLAEFENVTEEYRKGFEMLNGRWGRRILRAAQDMTEERLVPAVFQGDTRNIAQVYEIVGGKESEAGLQMQSSMLSDMFKKSQSPDGTWRTVGLRAQLNQLGDRKLKAIFDEETVGHLNDLADVMASLTELSKMSGGSQTAFLLSALEGSSPLGRAVRSLSYGFYGGVWMGAALLLGDLGFTSARQWLLSTPEGISFMTQRMRNEQLQNWQAVVDVFNASEHMDTPLGRRARQHYYWDAQPPTGYSPAKTRIGRQALEQIASDDDREYLGLWPK